MRLNNYPTVTLDSKKKVFVSFYINNKRYRLYNSNRIGGDFNPNSFPDDKRIEMGNVLAYKIYEHINNGGNLTAFKSSNLICGQLKDIDYITKAYKNKLKENYSLKYKWMFRWVYNMVKNHLNHSPNSIDNIVSRVRFLAKGLDCKYVIIDHVSIIVSDQSHGDERRALDEIMTRLRTLVQETGVSMIVVSHLRRPDGKGHEEGAATSLSQLRGSSGIGQLSDSVLGCERNQQDQLEAMNTTVRVLKNRYAGITGVCATLEYNPAIGRLHEYSSPFDDTQR